MKKNVFNYSELHFSEVTSYKIHTLTIVRAMLIKLIVRGLIEKSRRQKNSAVTPISRKESRRPI